MRPVALGAAVLLTTLMSAPAQATFVRSLMDTADTEPLFDSEYFLDMRAFSWPRAWDDPWVAGSTAAKTGGYRINAASLDCCALALDQGLVFASRLTPRLEFRFRFEHFDDKDRQEMHHWIELETALGRGWSAELMGEPTFRKEDSDIGLGVRWRGGGWAFRLRRIAVDFNFNSRGSTKQSDSLKPWTDQLTLESPASGGTARLTAEFDSPSRRDDPVLRRSFGYRRELVRLGWETDAGLAPRVSYSYERQERNDRYATQALGTSTDVRRRVHEASVSARLSRGDRDEFEPGAAAFVRSAQADDPFSPARGTSYKRWELTPWLRWRRQMSPFLLSELAPFVAVGRNRVSREVAAVEQTIIEAKLNAALEFRWSAAARIGLNASFDLDDQSHLWDGGNIRAMFFF